MQNCVFIQTNHKQITGAIVAEHASLAWHRGPSARHATRSGHGRSGACQHSAQQRGKAVSLT